MAFCVGGEEEGGVGAGFGEVVGAEELEHCGSGGEVLHFSGLA